MRWGDPYVVDISGIPIILLSTSRHAIYPENVTLWGSPEEALGLVTDRGYPKGYVAG
ncbi:MAG TPA: hypothetical protein PK765_05645 [bacterium]|nr:hypothetical protein [bacterium]